MAGLVMLGIFGALIAMSIEDEWFVNHMDEFDKEEELD